MSRTPNSKSGFYIDVGCPGCGGRLELEENFFVLPCRYCGSILRIRMPDSPPAYLVKSKVDRFKVRFGIDRYLKEQNQPLTDSGTQFKQIYYPYWKIRVILLKTRNRIETVEHDNNEYGSYGSCEYGSTGGSRTVETRKTEISLSPAEFTFPAGAELAGVPSSLGRRVEYLHAVPFGIEEVESDFHSLPVGISWESVQKRLEKSIRSVGMLDNADFGRNRTEFFYPVGSIVYFPYVIAESYGTGSVRRWIVDGVTGRVVNGMDHRLKETAGPLPDNAAVACGQLQVEHHRCGNCGYDLPERQSYIYLCRHCHQLITMEDSPCLQSELRITSNRGNHEDRLVPFWVIRFEYDIIQLSGSSLGSSTNSNRLVLPAFRLRNFESAYRLSRRISSALDKLDLEDLIQPDSRLSPVDIGPSEALIMAEVVCARDRMNVSTSLDLPSFKDAVKEMSIAYVPFHPEHYFNVDSVLGAVTFEKSAG